MEDEFLHWYLENETRFHQGHLDEKEIAYSAWLEGQKAGQHETIVIGDSWISTDDKLPEKEGNYLIYGNCTGDGERVDIAEFWNGQFEKHSQPTHWRPLPDMPKSQ